MNHRTPTLLFAALAASIGFAQAYEGAYAAPSPIATPAAGQDLLAAEQVRSDLTYLYKNMADGHYDLFAHRSPADYELLFAALRASVQSPMDRPKAAALLQRLAAFGRFGHAKVDGIESEFMKHLGAGGTILPIFIRIDGERVLLTRTADRSGKLRAGSELIAIDDEPIASWVERLGSYVSAERPYMAHAQMEESFPMLLWYEVRSRPNITVTVRAGDGQTLTENVEAVTLPGLRELAQSHPTPELATDFGRREFKLLNSGVAYLRPGPFMSIEAKRDGPAPSYEDGDYRRFLDDSFRRAVASGVSDLLIDLRNNPGGDNSFSDPMVAWFASRPFRFASRFMLKASAPTKRWYAQLRADGEPKDFMLKRLMNAEAAQANGSRYPFEIPLVDPRAGDRFTGRVWVLINRHSYSNAASVAALIQDYGFGTILGEETADVPTNYASSVHFTLPASGFSVSYPKSYFVRPNGDEGVRGVAPDVEIVREPIGSAEDVFLDAAIRHIRESRPPSGR